MPAATLSPQAPEAGTQPPAHVNIWPRGGAKSTHAEELAVYLGSTGTFRSERHERLEEDPELWLFSLFPQYMGTVTHGRPIALAEHHRRFWKWGQGLRRPKKFGLYVCSTQTLADDHVANIADMLQSSKFAKWYPEHAERKVTKYGSSAGWRRNRIRTAGGFTIDAIGLDTAARGVKIENVRPDFIILDDLDDENDSPTVTMRKIRNLTRKILPTQGPDCAVLAVQNLILAGGIFHQMVTGEADYLHHRVVSGPIPALMDFDPERDLEQLPSGAWKVIGGTPTWNGLGYRECEKLIADYGIEGFMVECQHRLDLESGLVFPTFDAATHEWQHADRPKFTAYYGGIDIAGEGSTAHYSTLAVLGLTTNGRLVLLDEWYERGANIAERQQQQMSVLESKYGHISWCGLPENQYAIQSLRSSFSVTRARNSSGSHEERIRRLGHRLALDPSKRPGFYYASECRRFAHEMRRFRRKPPEPGQPGKNEVIKIEDDVIDAVLYAVERAEGVSSGITGGASVVVA